MLTADPAQIEVPALAGDHALTGENEPLVTTADLQLNFFKKLVLKNEI